MSRKLKFAKMHGLGNDFMVIDAINQSFEAQPDQVRHWADRKSGIGFDQMLVVESPLTGQAQFKYRIYNADGGEVSQCGNGARCFARFVRDQGLTDDDLIAVETNTGLLVLELLDGGRVRVNMGVPEFEPTLIPLNTDSRQIRYQTSHNDQIITYAAVAIGNPHMVIQVDDVDTAPVATLGPFFESHALFPARVNVGFMQIIDRNTFKLRVFERGVGETRACGSGACAAMVCARQQGLLDDEALAFLTGGALNLEWRGDGNPVMMSGDTATVYQGEITYE